MKTVYDVIKKPIVTERSMEDARARRYTFAVAKTANKVEIREAVEKIFGEKMSELSGGRMTLEIYPSSQMGNATT